MARKTTRRPEFVQYQDHVLLGKTATTNRYGISEKEGVITHRLVFGNKVRLLEVTIENQAYQIQIEDIKRILD